ncbi:fibrous sheath-interacting protein 2-like isoform X2 [Anguilla rostrata]|uniref:fibrous sheath-interacting protein 2-like isoform X2 n=1 Tax=Anguilla anguilla TaxID=7936 RepID=UPI0015AE8B70|nr:fibrous sheath-interacting protein 2-like isoform X2 [Anguilla anguilla]
MFPPVKTVVGGTSASIQMARSCATCKKLPVPSGIQLTLSRAKIGETLYKPVTDFLRTGPSMRVMMPSYNCLHDPHLRHYYQKKELKDKLRKGNFITEDNEVICSLKDYNMYEDYLRSLKMVADRSRVEEQMDRMSAFLEAQGKGFISKDVNVSEITDIFLEENEDNLQKLLQTELAWQDRQKKLSEEDFLTELKQALFEQKCANLCRKMEDKIKMLEETQDIKKERAININAMLWDEPLCRPPKKEQLQLPKIPSSEKQVQWSALARIYGSRTNKNYRKQAEQSTQQKRKQNNAKLPQVVTVDKSPKTRAQESTQGNKQSFLPRIPSVDPPAQQSVRTRKYSQRQSNALQD